MKQRRKEGEMREESSSNYKQGLHRARWLPNCSQGVPTLGKVGWDWEKKLLNLRKGGQMLNARKRKLCLYVWTIDWHSCSTVTRCLA